MTERIRMQNEDLNYKLLKIDRTLVEH